MQQRVKGRGVFLFFVCFFVLFSLSFSLPEEGWWGRGREMFKRKEEKPGNKEVAPKYVVGVDGYKDQASSYL